MSADLWITMANILQIAESSSELITLATAIRVAELERELSGPGPFTIFAPSEAAFDKVPTWALQEIFKPKSKPQLMDTLLHHVIKGRIYSEDLRRLTLAETLQGQAVRLEPKPMMSVNGARVLLADVMCDNGVIHIIDSVIPPQ